MLTDWIGAGSALATAIVAIIALSYAAQQVRVAHRQRQDQLEAQQHARDYAFGQFLLQLDESFLQHKQVHRRLRPRHDQSQREKTDVGSWHGSGGPQSADEWADVEAYLGLFERIAVLVDRKLLDPDVVLRLYGYRMANIWANDRIRTEKLIQRASGWQDFLRLTEALEEQGAKFKRSP
jgi:hypothetical protein